MGNPYSIHHAFDIVSGWLLRVGLNVNAEGTLSLLLPGMGHGWRTKMDNREKGRFI